MIIINDYLSLVNLFRQEMKNLVACDMCCLQKSSLSNYLTWLITLWQEPGMNPSLLHVMESDINRWTQERNSSNPRPSMNYAYNGAVSLISGLKNTKYPIHDYISAYKKLVIFIFSMFDATSRIELMYDDERLTRMVAASVIFAPKQTVEDVVFGKAGCKENINKGNVYASWYYCRYRRSMLSEKVGMRFEYLDPNNKMISKTGKYDNNTYANKAIKYAVVSSKGTPLHITDTHCFSEYTACHIWDGQTSTGKTGNSTAYDNRFHTSLTNIVLIPSIFAGITDHNHVVSECLRIRSHQLYGHIPNIVFPGAIPDVPNWYSSIIWRDDFL